MRHGKKFNHLGRQAPHRKAMLANMACSLIEHKRVNTTVAKAKALKKFVEPLITKSKTDSTHSRRTCFRYLRSKEAVTELFREVSVKVADRPGGYTRILKTGFRQGDNAEMCFIELVDYNENMLKDAKKKTSSRKRRGGGKKAAAPAAEITEADTKAEVVEETPVAEVKAEKVEAKKEEKAPKAKVEEKKDAPKKEEKKDDKKEE
ncbi:MAG: 50S ribosomal protein L17 [Flavobacteriales bacterium]|nr:50S ribosomal protein L17 [Flavobacteriales bacterium]